MSLFPQFDVGALELQETLRSEALKRHSVDDFAEFDPSASVDSPRSLAACAREGVRPKDLTHVPPAAFELPGVPPEVVRLRAEFFEAHRQDLLSLVRRQRDAAVAGEPPAHPMSPCPDPASQYRNTVNWFRQTLQGLDINAFPTRPDWTTAPRSPEFKRVDFFAESRAMSPTSTLGPMAVPAFLAKSQSLGSPMGGTRAAGNFMASTLSGTEEPDDGRPQSWPDSPSGWTTSPPASPNAGGRGFGATNGSWWATTSSSWRSATSREALSEMLGQIRSAPGSDWKEHDAARRMEDKFGSTREIEVRRARQRNEDEQRLTAKRMGALDTSFRNLQHEQQRKDRLREIREYMAPPEGKLAGGSEGRARARENVVKQMEEAETSRRERFEGRIQKQHALEQLVDEDRFNTKVKFAQMLLEDRVRWRHNYAACEDRESDEREGVLEDFRRKQAQLDQAGRRAAENNALRREVHNLRKTFRLLDEYRRRRKEEHIDGVRKAQLRELGERRTEETGGKITSPTSSHARSFFAPRALDELALTLPPPTSPPLSPASPTKARALLSTAGAGGGAPAACVTGEEDYENEPLSPEEQRWLKSTLLKPQRRGGGGVPARRALARSATSPGMLAAR